MSRVPYSSVVGSLMYTMVCSSPDLAYAEHWKAIQWIMRYLRGSNSVCLQFGRTRDGVAGYVDSDYAGNLDKMRSYVHHWRL